MHTSTGNLLLQRAIASTENGITISDARQADSPLIFVNPAFLRLTGYAEDEVLGRNCRFLQGGDNAQPGLQALREAMASNREITVLLRNFRKTGEPFFTELTVSPMLDAAGLLTHYIGIHHDVTERDASAEKIRMLNNMLLEKTVELQSKNNELEAFSYSVAHDLRAPLATIQGFTSLMQRDPSIQAAPRAQALLTRISAGTRKMDALINALLDLAKAAIGQLTLVD